MGRTARELSVEDLETYRPLLALKSFQQSPLLAERRSRAWAVARSAADLLKKEFGATRVVVFGSLAGKGVFTPWSDIDLAVWGVKPEAYYRAAGAAMDMGLEREIKIDMVDPENCSEAFRAEIEETGIEV
jgi:predicted nucleotidyltransferase